MAAATRSAAVLDDRLHLVGESALAAVALPFGEVAARRGAVKICVSGLASRGADHRWEHCRRRWRGEIRRGVRGRRNLWHEYKIVAWRRE